MSWFVQRFFCCILYSLTLWRPSSVCIRLYLFCLTDSIYVCMTSDLWEAHKCKQSACVIRRREMFTIRFLEVFSCEKHLNLDGWQQPCLLTLYADMPCPVLGLVCCSPTLPTTHLYLTSISIYLYRMLIYLFLSIRLYFLSFSDISFLFQHNLSECFLSWLCCLSYSFLFILRWSQTTHRKCSSCLWMRTHSVILSQSDQFSSSLLKFALLLEMEEKASPSMWQPT